MRLSVVILAVLVVLIRALTLHDAAVGGIVYSAHSARSSNTTQRYLEIVRVMFVAMQNNMGAVDNAVIRVIKNVERQCPTVAAHAPVSLTRWRIEAIIGEELAIAGIHADARLTSMFLKRSMSLRWNDQQTTGIIQRAARAVNMQSHLREPELCTSLRQWASDRFDGVAHKLAAFNRQVEILSEMSNLLPNVLVKHERQFDVGKLKELRQLEWVVGEDLRTDVRRAQAQILSLVGLSK